MVLFIISIDNSEHSRNGDYVPNRLIAQVDAVNMLSTRKINPPSHPESTVGVLTMAGKAGVEVRIPPTRDHTKLLTATQNLSSGGGLDIVVAIKIAQLALKHRQNKAGEQRIVAFVSSPIQASEKELKALANSLRKEGVCVDIISMGEIDENAKLLADFIEQVDKDATSHLITIQPNTLPSTVLRQSPIFGGGGDAGGGGASGGFGDMGGFDPNEDPEMAMVMQMSMMEERARQEQAAKANADSKTSDGDTPMTDTTVPVPTTARVDMTEDELLQQALALSLMETEEAPAAGTSAPVASTPAPSTKPTSPAASPTKAKATAVSGSSTSPAAPTPASVAAPPISGAAFLDPAFVQNMLAGLPGVDMNDPRILAALSNPGGPKPEESKDAKDKEKK